MELKIEVEDYNAEVGLVFRWQENFKLKASVNADEIVITSNKEGLISLATHLLTLAQEAVPDQYHIHFDQYNSLEEGSVSLVVQKSL